MTSLITLLISLLGYGTPADYTDYTEDQLQNKIEMAQEQNAALNQDEDGLYDDWDGIN